MTHLDLITTPIKILTLHQSDGRIGLLARPRLPNIIHSLEILKMLSTISDNDELLYLDDEGVHRVGAELRDGDPGVGAVCVDWPH